MKHDPEFDYERWRHLRRYLDIPNTDQANISEKWFGLRSMGWTEEQCEVECEPKQINEAEFLELVAEASRKEQRELAKYNKEQAKLREREAKRNTEPKHPTIAPELVMADQGEFVEHWEPENLDLCNACLSSGNGNH